jgi:hypothetical protein
MLASGWVGPTRTVAGTFERLAPPYTDKYYQGGSQFRRGAACHAAKSRLDHPGEKNREVRWW